MGMGHCDQFLSAGYAQAHGEHDCNAGRVHEVLLLEHGRGDHAGSQGRERVL